MTKSATSSPSNANSVATPDAQQASQLKGDAQTRLQDRQQLRDLAIKQRQDLRNPNLTPAQRRELIAKQREEFRNLRAEQTNRRLGIAQQQTQQQQQAQQLRRDGKPPITADAARAGRFAARFQNQNLQNNPNWQARRAAWIASRLAARQAWRQGHAAVFVAWAGPVFYPYAYSDIFEYTFWPYAYDDGYWAYVYDDFVDSIFFVEAAPIPTTPMTAPRRAVTATPPARRRRVRRRARRATVRSRKSAAIRAKASRHGRSSRSSRRCARMPSSANCSTT